jgi:hypothetical protein
MKMEAAGYSETLVIPPQQSRASTDIVVNDSPWRHIPEHLSYFDKT